MCLTTKFNALPLTIPTMHMETIWSINQATRGWRCERADCNNVNVRGRSQSPRIMATMDLTIRSCRTAPLLHRTNLHADPPPLSTMSSARRASSQACVSLTGGLVYLNVLVQNAMREPYAAQVFQATDYVAVEWTRVSPRSASSNLEVTLLPSGSEQCGIRSRAGIIPCRPYKRVMYQGDTDMIL